MTRSFELLIVSRFHSQFFGVIQLEAAVIDSPEVMTEIYRNYIFLYYFDIMETLIKQDLHIHTVFSTGDSSIEPQQTVEFIAELNHAEIRGISDHFEYLTGPVFDIYRDKVHGYDFWCGCEVNDSRDAEEAVDYPFDYYIYHCRDKESEYRGAEKLLETGKPVICSHPMAMGADLSKVPTGCLLEINNRYVWKNDYMSYFTPHLHRFDFTIGSDAHKPNWLNQFVAGKAAEQLDIEETLLFPARRGEMAAAR